MIDPIINISKRNKYFSPLYWKLKVNGFMRGDKSFDSIEILEIEIDNESELGKILKGGSDNVKAQRER